MPTRGNRWAYWGQCGVPGAVPGPVRCHSRPFCRVTLGLGGAGGAARFGSALGHRGSYVALRLFGKLGRARYMPVGAPRGASLVWMRGCWVGWGGRGWMATVLLGGSGASWGWRRVLAVPGQRRVCFNLTSTHSDPPVADTFGFVYTLTPFQPLTAYTRQPAPSIDFCSVFTNVLRRHLQFSLQLRRGLFYHRCSLWNVLSGKGIRWHTGS